MAIKIVEHIGFCLLSVHNSPCTDKSSLYSYFQSYSFENITIFILTCHPYTNFANASPPSPEMLKYWQKIGFYNKVFILNLMK
jgi:hypothetical protein